MHWLLIAITKEFKGLTNNVTKNYLHLHLKAITKYY